jgi:hypothetical protein
MKMGLKINQNTIDKAETEVKLKIQKAITSPALLSDIAEVAITDIKYQARRGVSTETDSKFKPLSSRWIKQRQKIAQSTAVHEAFQANRSNVTITGQLLDAMSKVLTKTGIAIVFKGIHKPYLAKRVRKSGNRTIGKPIDNETLSEYVNEVRPFFKIRESLIPRLKNIVIRYIRRKL